MMMVVDKSNLGEDGDEHQQVVLGRSRSVGDDEVVEREHMFDKVVTPSDVGKLNRLVIPKQHAEKYFPLDSSTNDKGLLLNFEDTSGKQWRFRYSYWNSSQSYVMTKGWSRFVKEKRLDAGDIVSFQRGVGEFGRDRLFIDWRRRPLDHHHHHGVSSSSSNHHPHLLLGSAAAAATHHDHLSLPHQHRYFHRSSNILHPPTVTAAAWNPLFLQQQTLMSPPSSSSSSQAHYYLQPHYYRDHHYNIASHLLPPPAEHSQTATNNGQCHYSQPNFHYPNYYNNMIRSSSDHHYTGGTTTYYHNQAANPASSAVTSCSGSITNFRSAETAAAKQHRQQQEAEQEVGILQHYLQRPVEVIGADQPSSTNVVFESVPVIQGKAAAKRLRLFGVNMDCAVNNTSHFSNSAGDDIIVQCDNVNNTPNCGTIFRERGMNMLSQAPHHNNTSSHNVYYGSNSPSTATTVLPPPPCSSSAIPYLHLSPYPTATTVFVPDMLNKGKSSVSLDLDI